MEANNKFVAFVEHHLMGVPSGGEFEVIKSTIRELTSGLEAAITRIFNEFMKLS